MSDEIDIEEHDLLDNPTIKKIFPDLSVIKKEISQYFEDELDTTPASGGLSPVFETLVPKSVTPGNVANIKNLSTEFADFDVCDSSEENNKCNPNNIIILGSKPNKSPENKDNKVTSIQCNIPRVTLENIEYHLNKSNLYCKDCYILYPTTISFKNHVKTIHDHKKIYSRKHILTGKIRKCNICKSMFHNSGNLNRHLKNIHNVCSISIEKTVKVNKKNYDEVNDDDSISNASDTVMKCYHCHNVFPTHKSLIDHLYDILEPKKVENNDKCEVNSGYLENSIHSEVSFEKIPLLNDLECDKCAIKFTSKEKLDEHNLRHKHENINITPCTNKKTVLNNEVPKKDRTETDDGTIVSKRLRRNLVKSTESLSESRGYYNSQHNNEKLLEKIKLSEYNKNKNTHNRFIHTNLIEKSVEKAYQCSICFCYLLTFIRYVRHMTKDHNMEKVQREKKVFLNFHCKWCNSKMSNMKSYNAHIIKYHNEMRKLDTQNLEMGGLAQKELKSFAFNSVLYKCSKCDIHFLTAKITLDHETHMEMLINWKCSICSRIFKDIDERLHMKQHSYSQSFTVYDICETAMNHVTYICPKCNIHFSEDNYLRHYPKCGTQTTNSVNCKICDNLINAGDFDSHNEAHIRNNHSKLYKFITIETDLIVYKESITSNTVVCEKNTESLIETEVKINKKQQSKFDMTFCHVCQIFMNNFSSIRKAHLEGSCMQKPYPVCEECGLTFNNYSFNKHRLAHQEVKGLKIQNFFFFDFKSQIQICPPVPQYPNCKKCGVHFLSRSEVIRHKCKDRDHVVCYVCEIKLSKAAYKLHKQFHEYSMENNKVLFDNSKLAIEANKPKSSAISKADNLPDETIFYCCKICKITLDNYDIVVKHCQDHYHSSKTKSQVVMENCPYCTLNFDSRYVKIHEEMHLSKTNELKFINIIKFDPIYFRYDNNFWINHIFRSLSEKKIGKILINSMYRYECRVKMELFQSGLTNNTLYKCDKCLTFIDPLLLYTHAENLECTKIKKYPCNLCQLYFDSFKGKNDHEKMHKLTNQSLNPRIVVINKKKDQIFHNSLFKSRNQFVLYQCRNCYVAIDKLQRNAHRCNICEILKCARCGLLLHEQDYGTHFSRHEELDNFNSNHIVVILFGKNLYQKKQEMNSSFSGKICDYTFYKCKTCGLCIKTVDGTFGHNCIFDNDSKFECSKCNLWFTPEDLGRHTILHEFDTELESPNLNIIEFDGHSILNHTKHIFEIKENSVLQTKPIQENNETAKPTTASSENLIKIYKCDCNLHFIDEVNARNHYSNCSSKMKISKQKCSKCELLFTPGELFTHLLTHHRDKNMGFTFDIVPLSKDNKRTQIFKCIKCNLHFVNEYEANDHFNSCDGSSFTGVKCKKCCYRFKMSSYYKNRHSKGCEKKYYVNIITEAKNIEQYEEDRIKETPRYLEDFVSNTDMILAPEYTISRDNLLKIDISKYSNVLYKCNVCDVFYLTVHTKKRHTHFSTVYNACSICGLNFSLASLAKHIYIHHEKLNLTKDDFVIQ